MNPPKTGIEIAEIISREEKYRHTLTRIAKEYLTPSQLKKLATKRGANYLEQLEMAYENIQEEAKSAIKGRRK